MRSISSSSSALVIPEKHKKKKRSEKIVDNPKSTFSDEFKNVFTVEEIKAEVSCWKQLKNYMRGRASVSTDSNYFNQICGKLLPLSILLT